MTGRYYVVENMTRGSYGWLAARGTGVHFTTDQRQRARFATRAAATKAAQRFDGYRLVIRAYSDDLAVTRCVEVTA